MLPSCILMTVYLMAHTHTVHTHTGSTLATATTAAGAAIVATGLSAAHPTGQKIASPRIKRLHGDGCAASAPVSSPCAHFDDSIITL
eukprot:COSAG01_NODE_2609_length_7389_cov_19.579467_2_plen_87_part_00